MYSLFKKEINSFLNSLIGYISVAVFLIVIGLFLWVFPGNDLNIAESGYAAVDSLFNITPWVYMFLIPAITMRMFSEEKRTGTLEILLTKPLTEFQIVLAKYLSGLVLVIFSLLPTLVYVITVYQYAAPVGNIDLGGIAGSYIGLFFLASGFVAIGVFASSLA
ncbi:MAG TPA: ABC transporter permease subunit, partial [Bacteroidia bacterium]|nr:ABC transporter permease subunit [Bacteroidia bacterium]